MQKELVIFKTINAIPSENIQIVNSFHTKPDKNSGKPSRMILNIALNRTKANSVNCEFPVYIPAVGNYMQEQHLMMLDLFRSGVPWVPIECQNFRLYRQHNKEHSDYFAFADSFKVIDYSKITED